MNLYVHSYFHKKDKAYSAYLNLKLGNYFLLGKLKNIKLGKLKLIVEVFYSQNTYDSSDYTYYLNFFIENIIRGTKELI